MVSGFVKSVFRNLLLLLNIAAAVLLILASYSGYFNPEKYWYLGMLNLAVVYLTIFNLLFILIWLLIRKLFALISILAVFSCLSPLGNVFKWPRANEFRTEKEGNSLRVMSWNVELFGLYNYKSNPDFRNEAMSIIKKYDPDIACLQEMVCSDSFSNAINYLPAISKKLDFPYWDYSYKKRFDFDKKHHFGTIIYSKHPIIRKKTVEGNPRNYNSIFQYADILFRGDTIRVFNVHLQTIRLSEDNKYYLENPTFDDPGDLENSKTVVKKLKGAFDKHREQADRIRTEIESSPYPVIVCGDFNDVPNSYAYNKIGKGLKDVFAEKGSGVSRTFSGISPTLRIDYIFTDQRFHTLQYARDTKKVSDHFPIVADVRTDNDITR
jgi:endonuclease/exonuclease/phosphatase family metal-dependent hydrolase